MTTLSVPFIDYSNEKSTVGVYVADAILDANATTLAEAIEAVSIGTRGDVAVLERRVVDAGSVTPPLNKFAQRELKFLCRYTDNVNGKEYSFTIPCADADLVVGNTDMIDLGAGAGATLKTTFELYAISELGNAVTLNSVQLIGRSS
jgi:hypothetical protein